MARRDVDLVIKARDQAASVVDSITAALQDFIGAQKDLDNRADKTEGTLTSLGASIGKLDKQLKGLTPGQVLTDELAKSQVALQRLEQSFESTQAEIAQLEKQLKSATTAQSQYTAKLERAVAAQEKQKTVVAQAKADQRQLTQAYERAVVAQEKLQKRQAQLPGLMSRAATASDKAAGKFRELSQRISETTNPTQKLNDQLLRSETRMVDTASKTARLRQEFRDIGGNLLAAGQAITTFGEQAAKSSGNLSRQEAILKRMGESYQKIKVQTAAFSAQQKRLAGELARSKDSLTRTTTQLGRARAGLAQLGTESHQTRAALEQLNKRGFLALVSTTRNQKRAMLETAEAYNKTRDNATKLGAAMAKVENPTREMVEAFQRARIESVRMKDSLARQREALASMSQTLKKSSRDYDGLRGSQAAFLAILERLEAELAQGDARARKAAQSIRALGAAAGAASGNTGKLATNTDRLAGSTRRAATETGRLASATRRFYGDSRRSLSLLQRIRGEVLALVAAYGGLYGGIRALSATVDATQKLEAAQARLNVAFDDNPTRVAAEFDFVRRTSDRLGVSLGDLAAEYSKFNIATKNTSLEGAKARKIFLQIAEAARVNRSSTKDLQGVFVALTQIVSKGAVQMEELRQQLGDRLPGAIKIMADGLGVTTAELVKMMEQGQITEAALVDFANEIEKRFGSGLPDALLGITVALGRLENAAFQAAAEFGEGGFISALSRFANTLTEVLRSADFTSFIGKVSKALGGLLDGLGFLAENFQVVIPALAALIAFKLVPVVLALGGAFLKVTKAATLTGGSFVALQTRAAAMGVTVTRAGFAVRTLSRSLRLLVGSTGVGLAFIAISTALATWSTNADIATEALTRHRDIVDQVRNAYEEAGGEAEDWAEAIKGVTEQQAKVNLDTLRSQLNRARREAIQFPLAIENLFEKVIGGTEESRLALRELARDFRDGKTSVQEYKDGLEALTKTDPTLKVDFIVDLQDNADRVRELETAYTEAELTLEAFTGTAEEAKVAMDALNGVIDTDLVDKMAEAMSEVGEAVKVLEGLLPKTKTGMDDVADAADTMAKAYEAALTAARAMPEAVIRIAAEQALLNGFAEKYRDLQARALDFAVDNSLVDRIIGVESGGNPSATNANSTATGLGQFIESTWLNLFKQNFPDRAKGMTDAMILGLREDAALSRNMVQLYIRDNAKILQQMGVKLTDANLYLAHFLGPQGAANLIQSAPGTTANEVLSPGAISSNQSILDGKTREEIIAWAQRKVGYSEQELSILEDMAKTERTRAESTRDTIADNEFEISQQQKILDGKEREAKIDEAIRDAREDNPGISEESIALIREQTGALFDLELAQQRAKTGDKDASAAARDASQKVNALLAQRKALYDQLAVAQRDGDTSKQEELRTGIDDVNVALTDAIANARAMWEAIGGADAENALLRLDTAALKAGTLASNAQKVYLDWSRVAELFVTGLASAFDTFAKAVADGQNVFSAARDAFLRFAADFLLQIAQMIIQQAIFNALQTAFGGTGFGALIGLGHTGGMVGSSRVGSGNSSRKINPAIFAGAMRYHTGGMIGLRPGEVPIIAKEGEEMLTRDDPRHMMNGGGATGGGNPAINVRNINTFDAAGFLAAALDSPIGEQVLYNFVAANPTQFRAAMEG